MVTADCRKSEAFIADETESTMACRVLLEPVSRRHLLEPKQHAAQWRTCQHRPPATTRKLNVGSETVCTMLLTVAELDTTATFSLDGRSVGDLISEATVFRKFRDVAPLLLSVTNSSCTQSRLSSGGRRRLPDVRQGDGVEHTDTLLQNDSLLDCSLVSCILGRPC